MGVTQFADWVRFSFMLAQPSAQLRFSLLHSKLFTRMNTIFADVVYVVSATKNGQLEFWAAATPRQVAAAQVQRSLPPGWKATLRTWRFSRERAAELKMRPNTVRRLTEASSSQLIIGA
jgi:hypothetical protein